MRQKVFKFSYLIVIFSYLFIKIILKEFWRLFQINDYFIDIVDKLEYITWTISKYGSKNRQKIPYGKRSLSPHGKT